MPTESKNTHVCYQCGDSLLPSQFYKSESYQHYGFGHIPICKTCFERKLISYSIEYHSNKQAMKRMCMSNDIYYNDSLFESCGEDPSQVGKYFRKLNMNQYKGKTFDDTIEEGFSFFEDTQADDSLANANAMPEPEQVEIPQKDIEKWGQGLDPLDYQNLNSHYKFLKDANPYCDNNQEIFINDLCYTKMQQLKCVRNGDMDSFKKMGEYYNATFSKSGLRVSVGADANSDDCLGVWNARIAQYTPEEYYKDKKLYKDHDGFRDYIDRFVLRPIRNLMFGSQDRDPEYCVKDEGDEYEYSESDTE